MYFFLSLTESITNLRWRTRYRPSEVAARIFLASVTAALHGHLDGEPDGHDDEHHDEARLEELDPLVSDAVRGGGVHDVEASRLHGGGVWI